VPKKQKGWSTLEVDEILERIGEVINADKRAEIARALGKGSQTFNSWRYRNTIPWPEIIEFAYQYDVSLDWLILGRKTDGDLRIYDPEISKLTRHVVEILTSGHHSLHHELDFYINKLMKQKDLIESFEKEIDKLKEKPKTRIS
jgi:hypothetical protein